MYEKHTTYNIFKVSLRNIYEGPTYNIFKVSLRNIIWRYLEKIGLSP